MKPTTRPRVSLIQLEWTDRPDVNMQNALNMLEKVPSGTHLAVLPEFFLGPPFYFPGREHLKGVVDQTIPGPVIEELASVARRRAMYILCGTVVERAGESYYNTSVLLDDAGQIVARARKVHRFAAEMLAIEPGEDFCVVDTPFGRLGICVCSDFWIPEVPRLMALRGAEIIAVPGAAIRGNIQITRPCLQATSSFNVCYTLLAGAVGRVEGERAGRLASVDVAGCSTIAAPERILTSLDEEVGIASAELDLLDLRAQRDVDLSFTRSLYYCLHGRRPDLYRELGEHYVDAQPLGSLIRGYLEGATDHAGN